jgi:DNA-binding transcriptional LysR family regulator
LSRATVLKPLEKRLKEAFETIMLSTKVLGLAKAGDKAKSSPAEVVGYNDVRLLSPIPRPPAVRDFRSAHPRVALHMHQGSPHQIARMLIEGTADVGVTNAMPSHPQFRQVGIFADRLILCGCPERARQVPDDVTWTQLIDQAPILWEQSELTPTLVDDVARFARAHEFSLALRYEPANEEGTGDEPRTA